MPNAAPRGMFVRHGETWKPPENVYARVAGVWKQADFVWCFRDGAWQIVWGRVPVPPATASATWVQPSSVQISWTAPVANANTIWIVRRADNTIVGTVPIATLTLIDPRPLLASGVTTNGSVPAYTVQGSDGTTFSAARSTNTVTFNLTPSSLTSTVTYPNATSADVVLNWTPNLTYGAPQGWQMYLDGSGFVGPILAGNATTSAGSGLGTGRSRGISELWRIVPMALNAAGVWGQAGNANPVGVNLKAAEPLAVSLAAVGLSNLRLSWAHPSGTRAAYEIERHVNAWVFNEFVGAGATTSDWGTTVAGWMRVRTISPGGPSDWVQAGPVAPVNDNTGPGASIINQFVPESSYGRMVVRGFWPSAPDTANGAIFYNINGGAWNVVWGASGVAPNSPIAFAVVTAAAGQTVGVLIRTWDVNGNQGTDAVAYYALTPSPIIIDPNPAERSGTWRGSGWRNDSVRAFDEIATGWTSSGFNIGVYFYPANLSAQIRDKTITQATCQYWREDEGGLGAAIQPLFMTHALLARADGQPTGFDEGVPEAQRLGSAVARTGVTGGSFQLPVQFISALQLGNVKGLLMYRGYRGGGGDPDSFYMLLSIGGVFGGNPWTINGRLTFHHLG